MVAERVDRLGPVPDEVQNLVDVVPLKRLCRTAGVEKTTAGPRRVSMPPDAGAFGSASPEAGASLPRNLSRIYIRDGDGGVAMDSSAQKRAVRDYRARQIERGMTRFEVQAPERDRELIRALARRLAGDGPEAAHARTMAQRIVSGEPDRHGGILEALRRSPLVGDDLDLDRAREKGRRIDL